MKKNILDLIDELSDVIYLITNEIIKPKILKENSKYNLSELLEISLSIIEDIEKNFNEIISFKVEESNQKIDYLMNNLSNMFYNKKVSKESFTEEENQLYKDLLDNLHNLSKISIDFENKHHLGLHTFNKANFKKGLFNMKEGFELFWREFEK